MARAKSGDEVTVVIAIADWDERTVIFSTKEIAQKWMDAQPENVSCVCIDPMVVDVPEFGNEAQEPNG